MTIHYAIDSSLHTYVGVCREPGCCYRVLTTTHAAAIRARQEHAETDHRQRHPRATRPPRHAMQTSHR